MTIMAQLDAQVDVFDPYGTMNHVAVSGRMETTLLQQRLALLLVGNLMCERQKQTERYRRMVDQTLKKDAWRDCGYQEEEICPCHDVQAKLWTERQSQPKGYG
jgi:hypothetical protein